MPPQRPSVSPLKALRRKTSSPRPKSKPSKDGCDEYDGATTPLLDDRGAIHSLAYTVKVRDVPQIMQHVLDNTFDTIPERSGLNSVRTAELLNFRRSLPPLVTTTHIHALSKAPTTAEREIAQLVKDGVVRRLSIPGRGLGDTSIGEFLVLTEDWKRLVSSSPRLSTEVKDKYIGVIADQTNSIAVSSSRFTQAEAIELVQAGFLTSASSRSAAPAAFTAASSGPSRLASLASAGSRAPTGSVEAVGGSTALHDAGGSGVAARAPAANDHQLNFSLPSVGLYLRLLAAARQHLIALLCKSRPHEAPVDLLRERWDGGVASESKPTRGKGLPQAVLPGRTRKWKQFYGVKFQWILEECFGTGALEIFETGAVGLGARIPG